MHRCTALPCLYTPVVGRGCRRVENRSRAPHSLGVGPVKKFLGGIVCRQKDPENALGTEPESLVEACALRGKLSALVYVA